MIMAGDFRKGVTVEIDGQVWSITDFQHVKPGKGAAFVRTKLKNVMTGAVLEEHSTPQTSILRHISKPRKCSICMPMVSYTTLWTPSRMSSSHLTQTR